MPWWAFDKRNNDDRVLHHPLDAKQSKNFDEKYPDFHANPRNISFALSNDGMNPFDERTNTYHMASYPYDLQ